MHIAAVTGEPARHAVLQAVLASRASHSSGLPSLAPQPYFQRLVTASHVNLCPPLLCSAPHPNPALPCPALPCSTPEIYERLLPGLKHLHSALDAKAQEFDKIIKVGEWLGLGGGIGATVARLGACRQ